MRLISVVLIILFFTGCSNDTKDEAYFRYMRSIAKLIDSKYGLKVYGFGGFNEKGIKGYTFSFMTHKTVTVNESRILLVNVMEDILEATNRDLIKLGGSELSLDYYEITIMFLDEKTKLSYISDQSLAMVMMIKRDISYYEKYSEHDEFKEIYHESYSDAYEKVFGKPFEERTSSSPAGRVD